MRISRNFDERSVTLGQNAQGCLRNALKSCFRAKDTELARGHALRTDLLTETVGSSASSSQTRAGFCPDSRGLAPQGRRSIHSTREIGFIILAGRAPRGWGAPRAGLPLGRALRDRHPPGPQPNDELPIRASPLPQRRAVTVVRPRRPQQATPEITGTNYSQKVIRLRPQICY